MVMRCIGLMASMRAEHFLCISGGESGAGIWCWWSAFGTPGGFGCCPFWAVVLLLLNFCLVLLPLWESVIVLCFVVRYFVSILVLRLS